MDRVLIYGAGGHAKVVLDALLLGGASRQVRICDDAADRIGLHILGFEIEPPPAGIPDTACIVAIGGNAARLAVHRRLAARGWTFTRVVHPASVIARSATVGDGCFLAAGAIVNPDAQLGAAVIVNTAASVDHDCVLADGVHLAPGSRLCGGVHVGEGTLIGAGACVIPAVRIGAGVIVGAGAVVTRDVADGQCVMGVPARPKGNA